MSNKLLSNSEFESVLPRLGRLSQDTLKISRAVLVDGKTQSEVARENGISRQRVHGMVNRVKAALEDIPLDWIRIDDYAPPELANEIKDLIQKAKEKHYKSKEIEK